MGAAMKRRAVLIALALALVLTGCKTLEEVADDRERCHELGGDFSSWPIDADYYNTTCDLSDEKEA